jgi:hypothetical protein
MKTIYSLTSIFLILLLSLQALQAQETVNENLSRELTLEREYDPSIRDASKVNTLPKIKDPAVTKSAIDYAFMSLPADPQREIDRISSGKFMTERIPDKRRGYLNIGIGNYWSAGGGWNFDGDLGYNILRSNKDKLNVALSHRSTYGNVRYSDGFLKDSTVYARINDNVASLDFSHKFENATLKLDALYGFSLYNYYGLPKEPIPIDYYPGDGYLTNAPGRGERDTDQINHLINVGTGVESADGSALDYYGDIRFIRLSYKYGLNKDMDGVDENTFDIKFGLNAPLSGEHRLGADARFNYFYYNMPDSTAEDEWMRPDFNNFLAGTITPYYLLDGEFWKIKAGLNILFFTGKDSKIFASPNIESEIDLGARTLLYANAGGGINSNSLYSLSRENRYINPARRNLPSRTFVDAILGLKSGVAPGFWFNLFGGYKYTADDYFFLQTQQIIGFGNLSNTIALNSTRLYAGLELKYTWQQLLEITMKGIYNRWEVENSRILNGADEIDKINKPYGRPKVEGSASLLIRPIEKLSLALDYYMSSGRTAYCAAEKKMTDINELNFIGSYSINKTIAPYIRLNNILSQSYELIYGYPLQPFNFMVGVNISF